MEILFFSFFAEFLTKVVNGVSTVINRAFSLIASSPALMACIGIGALLMIVRFIIRVWCESSTKDNDTKEIK